MVKKSIVTSIRLNEGDFLKIKELKKEYGISWTKLIAYASELLEEDMNKSSEEETKK